MVTLLTMVALNVWGRGKLRLFSILIGMAIGYAVSYALGVIPTSHLQEPAAAPLISFPIHQHPGWSFDVNPVIPFAVAMICSQLKTVGDVTTVSSLSGLLGGRLATFAGSEEPSTDPAAVRRPRKWQDRRIVPANKDYRDGTSHICSSRSG